VTDLTGREGTGSGLPAESRKSKAGRGREPRRSWLTWVLVLWAALATAAAVTDWNPAPESGSAPGPAAEAPIRPRLPESSPAAMEAPVFEAFRNFAYFETAALLQLVLIQRERERLAAEAENLRRLQAAGASPAGPPPAVPAAPLSGSALGEDPQWVGLPPAPGVLLLDPIPETEEDLAAELANEVAPSPGLPPEALMPEDEFSPQPLDDSDIFLQPEADGHPPRHSAPEEEVFDHE